MKRKWIAVALLSGSALLAQRNQVTDRRTAEIRGGGGDGKCTIEVEVDGIADVEISGMNAQIRTVSGAPSRFRRFECNQEMPRNAYDFRFKGIDGRGRQDLVRPPSNSPAVIRIEDSKGGSEGYTFDIFWKGGTGTGGGFGGGNGGGFGGGNGGGFGGGNGGNRPGWGNNGGGWGNGSPWGNGNNNGGGWNNANREINFSGRGNGSYRSSNGPSGRLYDPNVRITRNGQVEVTFNSDQGQLNLRGYVERQNGNQITARVRGGDLDGTMQIRVERDNDIRRIEMQDTGRNRYSLDWRN